MAPNPISNDPPKYGTNEGADQTQSTHQSRFERGQTHADQKEVYVRMCATVLETCEDVSYLGWDGSFIDVVPTSDLVSHHGNFYNYSPLWQE